MTQANTHSLQVPSAFQPSRAEIAEEMRRRLELGSRTRDTRNQPAGSRH